MYSGVSSDSPREAFKGYDTSEGGYGFASSYGYGGNTDSKGINTSFQLSPNFSQHWYIDSYNQAGSGTISWDPVGNGLGPITNGLELSFSASRERTITADKEPIVHVSTLEALDQNGVTQALRVGMILNEVTGSATYLYNDDYPGNSSVTTDHGEMLIYKIEPNSTNDDFDIHLTGYRRPLVSADNTSVGVYKHHIHNNTIASSDVMFFKQPTMNGYSQYSCNRINAQLSLIEAGSGVYDNKVGQPTLVENGVPRIMPVSYTLEFVEEIEKEVGMPNNPAIWETEPKEDAPLDIYYEASGYNPISLKEETKNVAIPALSSISHRENDASIFNTEVLNVIYDSQPQSTSGEDFPINISGWYISTAQKNGVGADPLVGGAYINVDDILDITRPDGSIISVTVKGWREETGNRSSKIYISENLYGPDTKYTLNWHNCFSFGNGVESNRIRDNFNQSYIKNGVKASTTLTLQEYKEEHRKYGLIYSGLYNSISGVNNLNQFIAAEKITKDINPVYGSIQKLHARRRSI